MDSRRTKGQAEANLSAGAQTQCCALGQQFRALVHAETHCGVWLQLGITQASRDLM